MMTKVLFLPMLVLVTGCAVEVYHPTKSRAEMNRDIEQCKQHGKYSAPTVEVVQAVNAAYECLERRGYNRGKPRPSLSLTE